jgi:hypothetical protein
LLLATVATAVTLLILELRYTRVLMLLDGRRWASRFRNDEAPPLPRRAEASDPHRREDDH